MFNVKPLKVTGFVTAGFISGEALFDLHGMEYYRAVDYSASGWLCFMPFFTYIKFF